MRVVSIAAILLLASASEAGLAMSLFDTSSCNKGMLWPYVRNPGDCLTDAEIAAGQRGVYNGPTNTNPNIGGIPAPQPQAQPAPGTPAAPVIQGAPVAAPVFAQPNGVAAAPAAVAPAPGMQTVSEFSCNKGLLWPFRRKAGDCLTSAEQKRGMTGVFGGGTGMVTRQAPAPVQQVIYQQPAPAQPGQQVIYQQVPQQQVPQAQPGQQVIYQQAPQQPAPQVVYQPAQPGQQVVYQQAQTGTTVVDSNGQVYVVQPAPSPQQAQAATAGGCTKGPLWPFVKKPGDCPSGSAAPRRK